MHSTEACTPLSIVQAVTYLNLALHTFTEAVAVDGVAIDGVIERPCARRGKKRDVVHSDVRSMSCQCPTTVTPTPPPRRNTQHTVLLSDFYGNTESAANTTQWLVQSRAPAHHLFTLTTPSTTTTTTLLPPRPPLSAAQHRPFSFASFSSSSLPWPWCTGCCPCGRPS